MDPAVFAQAWEDGWNSHDLDRVLQHYTQDVVFRSRKAVAHTGDGLVMGKPALRAYWAKALAAQPDLRFTVEQVFAGHQTVVIVYRNHRDVRAAETLTFDETGLVTMASACHEA